MDEGYIKFNSEWKNVDRIGLADIASLNSWRQKLYNVNLLGVYPDGIGLKINFVNIIFRCYYICYLFTKSVSSHYMACK